MNELITTILGYAKIGVVDYCKNRRLKGLLLDLIDELDEMYGTAEQMNFEFLEMVKQVDYQENGAHD